MSCSRECCPCYATHKLTLLSCRQWESKPLDTERAAAFQAACRTYGFDSGKIVPHGS